MPADGGQMDGGQLCNAREWKSILNLQAWGLEDHTVSTVIFPIKKAELEQMDDMSAPRFLVMDAATPLESYIGGNIWHQNKNLKWIGNYK
jgi:hypothetical protein